MSVNLDKCDTTLTEQLLTAILRDVAGTRIELHHISSLLNFVFIEKYKDNPAMTRSLLNVIKKTMHNLQELDNAFVSEQEQEAQS